MMELLMNLIGILVEVLGLCHNYLIYIIEYSQWLYIKYTNYLIYIIEYSQWLYIT